MKIATWNVNSLRVRLPQVLTWLHDTQPDILALQEIKLPTEDFPFDDFLAAGYKAIANGQKTYNGVAVLYRDIKEPDDIIMELPGLDDPQRRVLAATFNGVRVIDLYVPNGESVTSAKYSYKLNWLEHLKTFLKSQLKRYPDIVVLGDFNIAPHNEDVYDPAAWEGSVLFSEPERAALQSILNMGFQDCFRLFPQPEKSYSWWDYRVNAFKRKMGLRIDHILASTLLAARCKICIIDPVPRGWERPTDHAPVLAEFA